MISTSFITGTGFMKCIPMTCSGRLVKAAISVMGKEEVLEARMQDGLQIWSRLAKTFPFTAMFSTMASTTRSHSAASFWSTEGMRLARAASFCSSMIFPLDTSFSSSFLMKSIRFMTISMSTSLR